MECSFPEGQFADSGRGAWKGTALMPRPEPSEITTALPQVQKQARTLLVALRKEIGGRKAEPLRLKSEDSGLGHLSSTIEHAPVRRLEANTPVHSWQGR